MKKEPVLKEYKWFRIMPDQLNSIKSKGREIQFINGVKILLIWQAGTLSACHFLCPHAGADLSTGECTADGKIICPFHRYEFDLNTGENTSGEGHFLQTYPIKVVEQKYFVGFEQKKWWRFWE